MLVSPTFHASALCAQAVFIVTLRLRACFSFLSRLQLRVQAYLSLRIELIRMTAMYERLKAAHEHDPRFIEELLALRQVSARVCMLILRLLLLPRGT